MGHVMGLFLTPSLSATPITECRCVGSNCLERRGDSSSLVVLLSGVRQQFDPVAKEKH